MLVIRFLERVNVRLTNWGCMLAGGLLAAMLVTVMMQVFLRYILASSLSWSEEVSKSLMIWSAFMVAPWTYRNGSNVSIEIVYSQLSQGFQRALRVLTNLTVLWLMTVLLWESFSFVERGWTIMASSIPITVGWMYLPVPISLFVTCLVSLELILREFLLLRKM